MPPPTPLEDKLDMIIDHLERMDRRDRWRTYGAFVRGVLNVIPLLFMLGAAWYALNYGEELLNKIISLTAEQVDKVARESLQPSLKGLQNINLKQLNELLKQ